MNRQLLQTPDTGLSRVWNHTAATSIQANQPPHRSPLSTSELVRNEASNKTKSKELKRRIAKQQLALANLTREIHHGGKKDFLLTLGKGMPKFTKKRTAVAEEESTENMPDWDGSLDQSDLIFWAKESESHESKDRTLYEELTTTHAASTSTVSAAGLLQLIDTVNTTETISQLRKLLPGYFASQRKVTALKAKFREEFNAVLKPKRTATGWRIDPERLRECLLFRYLYAHTIYLPAESERLRCRCLPPFFMCAS